jgi:hypothetical protein
MGLVMRDDAGGDRAQMSKEVADVEPARKGR